MTGIFSQLSLTQKPRKRHVKTRKITAQYEYDLEDFQRDVGTVVAGERP